MDMAWMAGAAKHLILFHYSHHYHSLPVTPRVLTPIRPYSAATRLRSSSTRARQSIKPRVKKAVTERHEPSPSPSRLKRRTRSDLDFDRQQLLSDASPRGHVPVLLGEVLRIFRHRHLHSFVDCTLGAAGHSSAVIRDHPEMRVYVGLDMDPSAFKLGQSRIEEEEAVVSQKLKAYTLLTNFRNIKSVLAGCDGSLFADGVDGILMDLGMSSMQVDNPQRGFSILIDGPLDMRMNPLASLRAEDILNSWPEDEIGRILRDYGEESNWRLLQRKIVAARENGGVHSTGELVDIIRSISPCMKGRQGWIKTATRVFQALRIAVNDELKTLEDALYACYDRLSVGGRLAVISFHSLEDRIVKHTFLGIIGKEDVAGEDNKLIKKMNDGFDFEEESWCKGRIAGSNGIILTKRPITPSEEEEKLNQRCRSAKLRVIQKI